MRLISLLYVKICPDGYALTHVPRSSRPGGGVGLLNRNSLKLEKHTSRTFKSFELMESLLRTNSVLARMRIVIVYRPPQSSNNGLAVNQFLDEFSSFIETTVAGSGRFLITRDFHFHFHVNDTSGPAALKFLDLLDSFNSVSTSIKICQHTRINIPWI